MEKAPTNAHPKRHLGQTPGGLGGSNARAWAGTTRGMTEEQFDDPLLTPPPLGSIQAAEAAIRSK